jgi:hypothetical protein
MSDQPASVEVVKRRGGLWHHLEFRRLWIGETVSQFGTMISLLALPLVAILYLHATTFEVGLLTMLESIAFLLVGLPAGAWVDRMRFRWVLIVNDLIRAAALGSIPLAHLLDVLTIGQMYIVSFVVSVSTVFFDVAYQSYLPALVDRDALVEGNSKLQASESVSQIAGPGLGGLLIQALTAPYAVLVDALSFVWSAMWVGAIRARPPKPERKPDRHLGREIMEGLKFVIGNRLLRSIAMCTGLFNLFSSMIAAVILVLFARELHLSAGVIGVLLSISAVGGLIGSFVANRFAHRVAVRAPQLDAWPVRVRAIGHLDLCGGLQHHPGELPSGVVPSGTARTDERHDAVPRVGNHAPRRDPRRCTRLVDRRAQCPSGRGDRRVRARDTGLLLAAAQDARTAEVRLT